MEDVSSRFFAVVSRSDWAAQNEEVDALRPRMGVAITFFMRFHLDALKASKEKSTQIKTVDALAMSIIELFPESKIPAEFLLLRSEDQDSRKFYANCYLSLVDAPHATFTFVLEQLST